MRDNGTYIEPCLAITLNLGEEQKSTMYEQSKKTDKDFETMFQVELQKYKRKERNEKV
jgi:hypothetical protein